jgi:hypothetical protein
MTLTEFCDGSMIWQSEKEERGREERGEEKEGKNETKPKEKTKNRRQ